MTRNWFLLWAAVLGLVAAWTFVPVSTPYRSSDAGLEVNRGKAFGSNEDIHVESRVDLRKQAFRALELPWGSRCNGEGRKQFIAGLNGYYYHRQNQTERYPENFGKLGADYIAQQWSSTDDRRIDRLTQDAYAKGYLNLADFDGVARKMVDTVIRQERITGKACED